MRSDEAIWPPEEETPTTEVLAGFCILMVVTQHSNENGQVEFPLRMDKNAQELQLTKWVNEYLIANQPLTEEERGLLYGLAVEHGLSEAELKGLTDLAEDGFGIADIREISLNGPILPGNLPPKNPSRVS